MAFLNALARPLVAGGPLVDSAVSGGNRHVLLSEFTLAADAVGVYVSPELLIPAGARVVNVAFNTDTSLGTTTIALGNSTTAGKYYAAAVLTSTGQWVQSNITANIGVKSTAAEQLQITTAVAALPASGRLLIMVEYVDNS